MGDGGEGLVDADSRIQERMEERMQEKLRRAAPVVSAAELARRRTLDQLRLARRDLEQQAENTPHPVRRQQLTAALAALDQRIAQVEAS